MVVCSFAVGCVQAGATLKWEATHMNSSEGENVMFLSSTLLEGPVEVSLPVSSCNTVSQFLYLHSTPSFVLYGYYASPRRDGLCLFVALTCVVI